jgi:4'-phosphopantetheinyl transferase EntD
MDQASTSALEVVDAIRAMLPAGIALAGGPIGSATSSPFAEENRAIQRAVEKRCRQFVAGRQYARSAMAQLGLGPVALGVLPSRAPEWPPGITGSITHAGSVCVTLVAPASDFFGIGVDVEASTPLSRELHPRICTPDELAANVTTARGTDVAKMLFVVKEAFFKAYHPVTGHFLGFLDADVRLDLARGTFVLELRGGPPGVLDRRCFEGRCGHAGGYAFAFVALRR